MESKDVLRTRIYVDGFNLYYGCLKGTPDKWLDLPLLFEKIIASIMIPPPYDSIKVEFCPLAIKYFTAPILANAAKAIDSVSSQSRYHTALSNFHPERVEIIQGYYDLGKANLKVVDAVDPKKLPRDCNQVATVWKLEEKQSDVNLALHALYDAVSNDVDHVVLVTNDTDIAPAAEMIRQKTGAILGLIVPTRDRVREPNTEIANAVHWCRSYITDDELSESQLPRIIQGKRKSTAKPTSWYERPDLLEAALVVAKEVLGKEGRAFKWLETEHPKIEGVRPIELLNTEGGLHTVKGLLGELGSQ